MTTNPTAAFEAFAAGQLDADDVFRVLLSFDDFLAPPPGAAGGW